MLATSVAGPAVAAGGRSDVQHAVDTLTQDGVPGAQATVSDRSGTWTVGSGQRFPWHAQVRVGSITKTFVATVVLRLVGEGRVELDAPVARYLPGVITSEGGDSVTVRQLLQHTSGLPDYLDAFGGDPELFRHRGADPAELVAIAMRRPPLFPPGTRWSYSGTNYILAGMLVERVTGDSLAHEIAARITRPLGLRGTYLPVRGEERIRGPHPRGYTPVDGRLVDFTDFDASIGWAAGALVSTGEDLDRFFGALVGGRLLPPAQLAEMRRTVPAPRIAEGARYGLGLASVPLPCGGEMWGHGGDIPGFATLAGVGPGGRGAAVVANIDPATPRTHQDMVATINVALCR
ncbi:serine hydrolase domain-containing protein [Kibdelosporangium lantanae]